MGACMSVDKKPTITIVSIYYICIRYTENAYMFVRVIFIKRAAYNHHFYRMYTNPRKYIEHVAGENCIFLHTFFVLFSF